ncbi:MAG: hypothetical protein EAX90_13595 [Candidatus Heimdallarchaeota archaeon]|nr:hypothetical protein [Candidatus Heimdallarchaeota archaeon]
MAIKYQRSNSMKYLLTKWFDKVTETHLQFLNYLKEIIEVNSKDILLKVLDLEKLMGKVITNEAVEIKLQLLKTTSSIEPYLIELIEYVHNFMTLLKETDGFELQLTSKVDLLNLLKTELETYESLILALKNLVKSINAVFQLEHKHMKKNEAEFEIFLKEYSRIVRSLSRDYKNLQDFFTINLSKLEAEVELAKQPI